MIILPGAPGVPGAARPKVGASSSLVGTSPGNGSVDAWWAMDDSGTTLADEAGTKTLSTVGAPTASESGVLGTSYLFNGSNEYANRGECVLTTQAYPVSIALWFKTDGVTATGIERMFSFGKTFSADGWIGVSMDRATGFVRSDFDNPGFTVLSGSTNYRDGAWHHVVAVWASATERYVYVDGSLEAGSASEADIGAYPTGMDRTAVGVLQRNSLVGHFEGWIDEVSVWGSALSSDNVTFLYQGGTGVTYSQL